MLGNEVGVNHPFRQYGYSSRSRGSAAQRYTLNLFSHGISMGAETAALVFIASQRKTFLDVDTTLSDKSTRMTGPVENEKNDTEAAQNELSHSAVVGF